MKRPEYAACAVSTLRTALDGYAPDMDTLKSVFSRSGFTDGYYTNTRKNMFGVRSKEDVVSAENVLPKIRESYHKTRKVSKLKFTLSLEEDKPATLIATDEMCSYTVYGEVPVKAINKPTDSIMAEKQLSKLGGTIYEFDGLEFYSNGDLMLPASSLNELRRSLISRIDSERIHRNEPLIQVNESFNLKLPQGIATAKNPSLRLRVVNFKQIKSIDLQDIEYIIMPMDKILLEKDISQEVLDKLIVQPPRFIIDELDTIEKLSQVSIKGVRHLMCNNLAYINIANRLGYSIHGDFGLNVINSLSLEVLKDSNCVDCVTSFEMKLSQVDNLNKPIPIGLEAYGRLPLMLVRNCPINNEVGCNKCNHSISDRTNRNFPVYCSNGYSEIFNADVMSISNKLDNVHNVDFYILSFLEEGHKEVSNIIQEFKLGNKIGTTKGLYFRGII